MPSTKAPEHQSRRHLETDDLHAIPLTIDTSSSMMLNSFARLRRSSLILAETCGRGVVYQQMSWSEPRRERHGVKGGTASRVTWWRRMVTYDFSVGDQFGGCGWSVRCSTRDETQ